MELLENVVFFPDFFNSQGPGPGPGEKSPAAPPPLGGPGYGLLVENIIVYYNLVTAQILIIFFIRNSNMCTFCY